MNPVTALGLGVLCVIILTASRRGAFLALLAGAFYLAQGQGLHLAGLNLFPTRVLEIVLFVRVMTRREWTSFSLNTIDRAVLIFYAFTTVVYLLRATDGQVFQVGLAVDAFLVYFSCRSLIESPEDVRWLLRSVVLLLIPLVLGVAIERLRGSSPLAFMGWGGGGGAWMRDERIRCFGSFRHPSLLGTISVSFIPIFIGMATNPVDRFRVSVGIALCCVIVWAANSGGPISGVGFGCVAWMCWKARTKMRIVRWGIVAFLAVAGALMKAPIWYLIARVSSVTGGDGWHRAYLMEVSYRNLGKWWFAGMPISETFDWFPYSLAATNGADITNQFISFGLMAGIGAMALFVLLLTRAFSQLGKALQVVRIASSQDREAEFFLWGLGVMLAAHIVNWLGITYYDQTYVIWFAQLAAISTVSQSYLSTLSETVTETREDLTDLEPQELPIRAQ